MAKNKKRDGTQGDPSSGPVQWATVRSLVESLGNISEACRRAGIPRHLYYKLEKENALHPGKATQDALRGW